MKSNTPFTTLFFFVLFGLSVQYAPATGVDQAGTPGVYTINYGKFKMQLDFSGKASVTSMFINGREVVHAADGMFTLVNVNGKAFSSLQLLSKPFITESPSAVTLKNIKYGDQSFTVSETWIFLKTRNNIVWKISRSFSRDAQVNVSASPVINFESFKTWDGAFTGYGGLAWFYLFTEKPSSYGVHSRSSSFWSSRSKNGLDITVSSPGRQVVMTYKRTADDRLSCTISTSGKEITALNDIDTHRRLFIRGDGNVWEPIPVKKEISTDAITFTYVNTTERYDRGNMPGVNGAQVSAVLNTIARIGVIDSLHYGGNSWATPYGPICLHEQYIGLLGLGINDPRYLNGYKACLDYYRDHAFKPDGRVYPRWAYTNEDSAPGQYNKLGFYEAQWGMLLDSNPDFVANVADLFDLTGDKTWVKGQQRACEKALGWLLRRDENHNGLVEMVNRNQTEQKSSDWIDIVWASYENAFVNAKLYHALVKWAAIEHVLGNQAKAQDYAAFAAKLKSTFNKPTGQGGFWNEEKQCYIHWRDDRNGIHGLNMVTPVNFMAVTYGICDQPERQKAILDEIERQMQQEKMFFWPITLTSYAPGELRKDQLPFPNYENGDLFLSWGSLGVAAYARSQPAIALKYVKNVLEQYGKDGLAFQRYSRKDQSGQGDDILAGNSLAIVGLYQSVYGVNPLFDRLLLDPHLTPELNGTVLKYHYHNQLLKISLDTGRYTISNDKFSLTAKTQFGYAATANQLRYYDQDKPEPSLLVNHTGGMNVTVISWNAQYKELMAVCKDARPASYKFSQLYPSVAYKIVVNGKIVSVLRSDSNGNLAVVRSHPAKNEQISLKRIY